MTYTRKAALRCGVSAAAIALASGAWAQTAQTAQSAVEEVLVTGSLIRGAAAVGVPVTTLGVEDFKTAGALTTSDMLKTVPSVFVLGNTGITNSGGDKQGLQRVGIHTTTGGTNRTLFLIDGLRVPPQADNASGLDPSIIPALALERLDVLADGASSTYGSDAVSGVINIILKRGFSGAVTVLRIAGSTDIGGISESASQLYGRTWDGGDVTVTFEYAHNEKVRGPARPYFTWDFSPWGLDNVIPLSTAEPGIVSTGRPAAPAGTPSGFSASIGTTCANCFSIPKGQNGKGLTWAQIAANPGVKNEINPNSQGDILPEQQRSAAVITFDQHIWRGDGIIQDVEFFADGYYNNHRNAYDTPVQMNFKTTAFSAQLPSNYPYLPIGAPSGLFINYNLMVEIPGSIVSSEVSNRFDGGFNITFPFDWAGKIFLARSEEKNHSNYRNQVNKNLVTAALGGTVAASGSFAAFTKPNNIPTLNVFCDPTAFTCNDPATLRYVTAHREVTESVNQSESGFNFDGPLLDLPGGTLRAAVGGNYLTSHRRLYNINGQNSFLGDAAPSLNDEDNTYNVWAFFGQLNIPLVSPDNAIPLVHSLEAELSGRIDHYSKFGTTKNPKLSVTWDVGGGLSLRGSTGTSFRAPDFNQSANGIQIEPQNSLASIIVPNSNRSCPTGKTSPVPGSAGALLNPTCSSAPALLFPGGIVVNGGAGGGSVLRPPGFHLEPETARNWSVGFEYAPTNFLSGLDVQFTLYYIKVNGLIEQPSPGGGLTDPNTISQYILNTDPNFPTFLKAILSSPFAQADIIASNISFIQNDTTENLGWEIQKGIDFSAAYDWDMGDLGAWNVGITGNYQLLHKIFEQIGSPIVDFFGHGAESGGRLNYRARLGWTDSAQGHWNASAFMNYRAHWGADVYGQQAVQAAPPSCFIQGNTPCNASGLPQFAQYTRQFPQVTGFQPAYVTADFTVGYDTGDQPANEYLKNIGLQVTVNNVLNKKPPFAYVPNASAPTAYNSNYDPMQRTVSLRVTKTW